MGPLPAVPPPAFPTRRLSRRRWLGARVRAFVVLGCSILSFPALTHARPLQVGFTSPFQSEIVGPDEGFPENSCSGVAPAPDGSLWIGTFRGLVRYNGLSYRNWAPPELPDLAQTGIVNMHRDRAGGTWFSTTSGLVRHHEGRWQQFNEDPAWREVRDYVRSYADHPEAGLVFGRFGGTAVRFDGKAFHPLPPIPGRGGAFCGYDRSGALYAVRSGVVWIFADGAWRELDLGPQRPELIFGVGQHPDGDALLVTPREILRLQAGRVAARLPLSREVRQFWHLAVDTHGAVWLASLDSGAFHIAPDGRVLHLIGSHFLAGRGGARVVYPAPNGVVWIGSSIGGFARLRPVRFRYLSEPEAIGDREILSIAPLPDGSVLLAPSGAALHRFDGTTATPVAPAISEPGAPNVRTVLRARDGTVWCGTLNKGLMRWENGQFTPFPTPIVASSENVHTLFEDTQQRLWVGSGVRVVRIEEETPREITLPPGRGPTVFAERRDGTMLLARNHELFTCTGDRVELLARLVPSARIGALLVDRDDRIWIGTFADGLAVFHEGTLHPTTSSRNTFGSSVHTLIQDERGFIWMGGERRIMRAAPEALWELFHDPAATERIQMFDMSDGLSNVEFPFGVQPSVARDDAGRLWFALIRGVTMIDPARLVLNDTPPPVIFESLSYRPPDTGTLVRLPLAGVPQPVKLPAGSRAMRFEFAGLDLAAPAKQRFRAILDGTAQSAEPQPESVVSFFELPPGEHTLRIQAAGSDGAWNLEGATLAFTLAPFYWQTTWFRVLAGGGIVGLVAGGAWLASQLRVRRMREQLAREQRLAAAQARLALVVENTTDFVQFADASGNLLFINRASRALVGIPDDADLTGLPATRLFADCAREQFSSVALPAAHRAGTWSGELVLRRADGRDVPVSAVLVAHHTPDGALDFVGLVARDISAARRHGAVQEALRDLATALTASLEPEPLGRAIATAVRRIFQNDAFLLLLVDEHGEITLNAYSEDTPPGATQPQPVAPAPRTIGGEVRSVLAGQPLLINRDPANSSPGAFAPWGVVERRSESLMFAPIMRDGRAIGIISVQSYTPHRYDDADLQQLKILGDHCAAAIARMHVEMQLRANEGRLRLAMQVARMASWEIDPATRTLLGSPEAEALYGRPLSGAPETLAAGVPEPHADEFRRLLGELLEGRLSELNHTHPLTLPDGTERWLEVKALHPSRAGNHTRIIGLTADVSTRKRAELERTRLEEQLRQSQKLEAVGTLAGGIAHDFNNILTAILGNVELARLESPPDIPVRDFLDRIHGSGLRARDLVRRLLAFSRPQRSQRRSLSLQPVIREVVDLLRATIPTTTELRLSFDPDAPAVEADPTEIHQVLLNLGTNAWHALGNRPGWIAFKLDACAFDTAEACPHPDLHPGRYARVRVQDNGKGIPAAALPRIFDPFFTTKAPGEGTGLGLSVAHGIMRSYGGAIAVQSTVGVGTTFDLYFPASDTPPASPTPGPSAKRPDVAPGSAGRVLFVDDEEDLLLIAQRVLSRAGYAVAAFRHPAQALARFRFDPRAFDVVLTDLAMPEMSGLQLAEQILALRRDIPVLIASGHIRTEIEGEARRIGVRAVIDKIEAFQALPELLARHIRP